MPKGGSKGYGSPKTTGLKGMKAVPRSGRVTGPVTGPAMKSQPVQKARRVG
jgi:hypothetical protein